MLNLVDTVDGHAVNPSTKTSFGKQEDFWRNACYDT